MPWFDWQSLVAMICVAGALGLLIRRAIHLFSGPSAGSGCGSGSCGQCPANGDATGRQRPIVSLELPDRRA